MKKILLCLLLFSYVAAGVQAAKNDALCDKYLRLHIIAESNSSYDQCVKMAVSDYFFSLYEKDFKNSGSKKQMLEFINTNIAQITDNINSYLENSGIQYRCQIKTEKTKYKKSVFKNISLPNGEYDSVKIILGKGKGKNIFFIMFPNLSLQENVTVKVTGEKKITYKSKIAELLGL